MTTFFEIAFFLGWSMTLFMDQSSDKNAWTVICKKIFCYSIFSNRFSVFSKISGIQTHTKCYFEKEKKNPNLTQQNQVFHSQIVSLLYSFENVGPIWYMCLNICFQFLNNITSISIHFFTHTNLKKNWKLLFKHVPNRPVLNTEIFFRRKHYFSPYILRSQSI